MTVCFEERHYRCGTLYLAADAVALRAVAFSTNWPRIKAALGAVQAGSNPVIEQAAQQLHEYFTRQRQTFDLPLHLDGTAFQRRTWQTLQAIPYGETRSYAEQAALLGQPQAVRAVGRTNGLNPLCIIIPCHRVIAKSGKLAGYAGGLEAKQYLLQLEAGG
jgi:methylated-DNA-[protein]-cysteine S-methyltransferase